MRSTVLWLRRSLELAMLTTVRPPPIDCIPVLGGNGGHSLANRPRIVIRSGSSLAWWILLPECARCHAREAEGD
jgi:hypothetical protein